MPDEPRPLIRTSHKSKLGREFSYPLAGGEISRALQAVPQFAQLEIRFYESFLDSKRASLRAIRKAAPHMVCAADYYHPETGISACNSMPDWYREHWTIHVYPVLRSCRNAAHALLLSRGLRTLADWLFALRPETWLQGRHRREIWFQPVDEQITIRNVDR